MEYLITLLKNYAQVWVIIFCLKCNEPNAWQDEWCPCGVTRDGTNEAVIDPMEKGDYSFKHVFGDDEWRK